MARPRVKCDENNPINTCKIKVVKKEQCPRQYQCMKCMWIFNRLFNARRHYERFHLPKELIICKKCGKLFLLKWDYHKHRERIHKIIKHYGKDPPLKEKKLAASSAEKHQLKTFKQNVPAAQPIENIINPLWISMKKHYIKRWNEENEQKALSNEENQSKALPNEENQQKPIENVHYINNGVKEFKLSTSNDASNVPLNLVIVQNNAQQPSKYNVTSVNSLTKILSSKIDF